MWAGEACLVGMGHEVIVETVLPGEGGLTDAALKRSQTRVAPEENGGPHSVLYAVFRIRIRIQSSGPVF